MLLVLFLLHGLTSWLFFAFGSSCLLWKLSSIDFLKKLFQMCLGRGLENSSFWHSSNVLILGSACEHLVRGTKGTLTAFSAPLQAWFTSLAGLRVINDSVSFDLLSEKREGTASPPITLTKPGLVLSLPVIKWGLCKCQLFWDAIQCSVTADKEGVLTTGSVPNPTSCKKALASSTHACKIVF